MKCPECGHEMGKGAKCLRCGYAIKAIVPIDPEKIEEERDEPTAARREINPDDVHVSRAGGGSIFGDMFGGGLFGGLGGIFDSLFGGFFGMDDDADGYEYDPKYYDDFGNEIYVPDEFERDSVEIENVELLEEKAKHEESAPPPRKSKHEEHEHRHGESKHGGGHKKRPDRRKRR